MFPISVSMFDRPGHQIGNFTHGHTIALDSKGNFYIAEADWGRWVQRFRVVEGRYRTFGKLPVNYRFAANPGNNVKYATQRAIISSC